MSANSPELPARQAPPATVDLDLRESSIVKSAAMNFIGMALPKVVALVAIPFTIRMLGTDRFGILSLIFIVFGYFGFLDLGLSIATVRYIAQAIATRDLESVPKYLWTTAIFQFGLGLAGAAALAAASPWITGRILKIPAGLVAESQVTLVILALSLPIVLVTASFRGALEAAQRFDIVNVIKTPSSMLNYIVPLVAAALGFGLPGVVLFLFVVRLLTLIAYLVECFRVYPRLRFRFVFDKNAARSVLTYGLWVQVSNIISPVLAYMERFMIGALLTVQAVSYYTAPSEAIMSLAIIPNSLLIVLFPAFSALDGRRDGATRDRFFGLAIKILLMAAGVVSIILIFFAEDILTLWLGADFAKACTTIFQIMAVLFFLNALANVPYSALQGGGRADMVAKINMLELVLSVPLAWVMIQRWGLLGAALSWAVRIAVDTLLLFAAAMKIGKIKASSVAPGRTGHAALALAILATAGIALKRVSWGGPVFASLVLVFLGSLWAFVLDAKERTWIRGQFRILKTRFSFKRT